MAALIDACAAAGFRQMIGYIDAANAPSLAIHEKFGFRKVGFLPQVGFKFGHWTDSVMVQRSLGLGGAAAAGVLRGETLPFAVSGRRPDEPFTACAGGRSRRSPLRDTKSRMSKQSPRIFRLFAWGLLRNRLAARPRAGRRKLQNLRRDRRFCVFMGSIPPILAAECARNRHLAPNFAFFSSRRGDEANIFAPLSVLRRGQQFTAEQHGECFAAGARRKTSRCGTPHAYSRRSQGDLGSRPGRRFAGRTRINDERTR